MKGSFVFSCVEHHVSQVGPVMSHARTSAREHTLHPPFSTAASILPISSAILSFSSASVCGGQLRTPSPLIQRKEERKSAAVISGNLGGQIACWPKIHFNTRTVSRDQLDLVRMNL